jgi:hypothetical protein
MTPGLGSDRKPIVSCDDASMRSVGDWSISCHVGNVRIAILRIEVYYQLTSCPTLDVSKARVLSSFSFCFFSLSSSLSRSCFLRRSSSFRVCSSILAFFSFSRRARSSSRRFTASFSTVTCFNRSNSASAAIAASFLAFSSSLACFCKLEYSHHKSHRANYTGTCDLPTLILLLLCVFCFTSFPCFSGVLFVF